MTKKEGKIGWLGHTEFALDDTATIHIYEHWTSKDGTNIFLSTLKSSIRAAKDPTMVYLSGLSTYSSHSSSGEAGKSSWNLLKAGM
jgi:hypothetical protein